MSIMDFYTKTFTITEFVTDICPTVKFYIPSTLISALHLLFFTVSMFSIAKEWWHSNDTFLSDAHSQKTLIHASNQPTNPHIRVIGPHACMTITKIRSTLSTLPCRQLAQQVSGQLIRFAHLESKRVPSSRVPL